MSILLVTVADQPIGGIAVLLFALFMAYWTSPLRTGEHTELHIAESQAKPDTAIILWAPGDAASSRMQVAFRSPREDVIWVNVLRDREAYAVLTASGGLESLPLVRVGETEIRHATVTQVLDAQAAARQG